MSLPGWSSAIGRWRISTLSTHCRGLLLLFPPLANRSCAGGIDCLLLYSGIVFPHTLRLMASTDDYCTE